MCAGDSRGCGYDEWIGPAHARALAAQGIRQARAAWPSLFIGVWGHTPDNHTIELMRSGAASLYMLEVGARAANPVPPPRIPF